VDDYTFDEPEISLTWVVEFVGKPWKMYGFPYWENAKLAPVDHWKDAIRMFEKYQDSTIDGG